MSRSLDIAKILRATELDNTSNNRLLYDGEDVRGMDSATVQSTGMQYYSTLDSLPTTNLEVGLLSFVEENRRLYLSDGNGWYNTAYVASALPYWVTEPDSTYEITDSATPLTITALANDSDNPLLVNQSFGSDSQEFMATVTNDSSVFTFTPKSADSISQSVIAGDLTDSNGDFIYTFKWSDGVNFVAKEVIITYNTGPAGGGVWYGDRGLLQYQQPSSPFSEYAGVVDITTNGNASQFGSLEPTGNYTSAASDKTIGVWCGDGLSGPMCYLTFATSGNAVTFGDGNSYGNLNTGFNMQSNGTYGMMMGGYQVGANAGTDGLSQGYQTQIQRFTFAQTSTRPTDFGNLQEATFYSGGLSSASKSFCIGGSTSDGRTTDIEIASFSTAGTSTTFGNTSAGSTWASGLSDQTRGVYALGYTGSHNNTIEYITLDTSGDATDFGNMLQSKRAVGATNNSTRGIFWGGYTGSQHRRNIDVITIQTTGNATDFGDLPVVGSSGTYERSGCSGNAA